MLTEINVPAKKISFHSYLLQNLQSTQVRTDDNWLKVVGECDKSVIAKSAYRSDKSQL